MVLGAFFNLSHWCFWLRSSLKMFPESLCFVSFKILQNSPYWQLYTSARDGKGVGDICGSHSFFLLPILNQMNLCHNLQSSFIIIMYLSCSWATCWPVPVSRVQKPLPFLFKNRFTIISSQFLGLFPSVFPIQTLYALLRAPAFPTCPGPLHPPWFCHRNNRWWGVNIINVLIT
jgi:hypothetical protein